VLEKVKFSVSGLGMEKLREVGDASLVAVREGLCVRVGLALGGRMVMVGS
jgi:hypothetical protein